MSQNFGFAPYDAKGGSEKFVMLCGRSSSGEQMAPFAKHLADAGINVWYDTRPESGALVDKVLMGLIEKDTCAGIVLFLTGDISTPALMQALRQARTSRRPIIGVQLEKDADATRLLGASLADYIKGKSQIAAHSQAAAAACEALTDAVCKDFGLERKQKPAEKAAPAAVPMVIGGAHDSKSKDIGDLMKKKKEGASQEFTKKPVSETAVSKSDGASAEFERVKKEVLELLKKVCEKTPENDEEAKDQRARASEIIKLYKDNEIYHVVQADCEKLLDLMWLGIFISIDKRINDKKHQGSNSLDELEALIKSLLTDDVNTATPGMFKKRSEYLDRIAEHRKTLLPIICSVKDTINPLGLANGTTYRFIIDDTMRVNVIADKGVVSVRAGVQPGSHTVRLEVFGWSDTNCTSVSQSLGNRSFSIQRGEVEITADRGGLFRDIKLEIANR